MMMMMNLVSSAACYRHRAAQRLSKSSTTFSPQVGRLSHNDDDDEQRRYHPQHHPRRQHHRHRRQDQHQHRNFHQQCSMNDYSNPNSPWFGWYVTHSKRNIHGHYNNYRYFSTPTGSGAGNGKNMGKKDSGGGGEGRIPMPDKEEELKLASIQATITEHYKRGDFPKALEVSKDLLKQTENHFGQNHPATASAYNNMGLMEKMLGDFIAARKHYQAAMSIYGKVVGRDHASYAMTLHNLGTLNKTQVHFDTSLKAIDRLSLVETALEYLDEAWAIRRAELGDEHPHTVSTRSTYGSTLAAQVLYQHKYVEGKTTNNQTTAKGKYVSLSPQSVTQEGWTAAEVHLREALTTAIENPRGKSIRPGGGTKKQKKKRSKKQQQQGKNLKLSDDENDNGTTNNAAIGTLSAASAAQNLAVFLKSKAMTEEEDDDDDDHHDDEQDDGDDGKITTKPSRRQSMLQEAYSLYRQVKQVRSQLLPEQHPDLYATNYSLAELLDVMGDEEAANALRQEIIDTYDPPSSTADDNDQDDAGAGDDDDNDDNETNESLSLKVDNDEGETERNVIVEKTKGSK